MNTMDHQFSHLNEHGQARMVDVSEKIPTKRKAIAKGCICMQPDTLEMILKNRIVKGNVFDVARIAGIMGAKRTSDLIPLCHPLAVTGLDIVFQPIPVDTANETNTTPSLAALEIEATVKTTDKTGVEMEALTAVAIAALTIYDMCKAVDRGMIISEVRLVKKTGGKSGTFEAP